MKNSDFNSEFNKKKLITKKTGILQENHVMKKVILLYFVLYNILAYGDKIWDLEYVYTIKKWKVFLLHF